MLDYLLDWGNLLLRWTHVITAIAWIGSSFYFVFLDSNLLPPQDEDLKKKGVDGAMWAVHGGGFYHPQKYMIAPKHIDSKLHWFYWESYSTWLSGFALFTLIYLFNAEAFLIDKSKFDWGAPAAISASLGFLLIFWLVYDAICRVFGSRKNGERIVSALLFVVVCFASYLATELYSGRAAFLLIGAMLATSMSANVFFWIIPGQKKAMAQMAKGEAVDPALGKRAKQRSVHNTYFTLPVVFSMLSTHYSFLSNHAQNWLVLILMMLAGALIRQFFVMRHAWHNGRARNPWPYAALGIILIAAVALWLRPDSKVAAQSEEPQKVGFAEVKKVFEARCYSCHGATVQMKNLRLDQTENIVLQKQNIYQNVVVSKIMPLGNATAMTEQERELVARWFKEGASTAE